MTIQWWLNALAEGAARALASLVLFPITYVMLKWFLWFASDWAQFPELSTRQVVALAFGIAIFGR